MPSNSPKTALGAYTLKAMRENALLFRDVVAPACTKHDLPLQQFYVVSELADNPHQTVTALADRAGILRTNFAAVCHRMEMKGLVKRERGTEDKRKVYLSLTEEGEELFKSIVDDVEAVLDRGSVFMSEEDYLSIRNGTQNLHKLLKTALG